jgi:hypothetical protein
MSKRPKVKWKWILVIGRIGFLPVLDICLIGERADGAPVTWRDKLWYWLGELRISIAIGVPVFILGLIVGRLMWRLSN